jgi:hypothetical protein
MRIPNPVQHDWDVVTYVNAHTDPYTTAALALRAPRQHGKTMQRRDGPKAVVYVTRLRNGKVRVRFRDYISVAAASAALRR